MAGYIRLFLNAARPAALSGWRVLQQHTVYQETNTSNTSNRTNLAACVAPDIIFLTLPGLRRCQVGGYFNDLRIFDKKTSNTSNRANLAACAAPVNVKFEN
jgi:hypothetical protein